MESKQKKKIPINSTTNIIRVSLLLCLVCSLLVSSLAILFREKINYNKKLEVKKYILEASGIYNSKIDKSVDINTLFEQKVEKKIINLSTGKYDSTIDSNSYNMIKAAKNPKMSTSVKRNLAGITRVPKMGMLYLIKGKNNQVIKRVIHIWGKGLWSTMYGFLAIQNDMQTIDGISFNSHGETPGLGGEIDNPNWKKQWKGKKIFGKQNNIRIKVIKGKVNKNSKNAIYQVDGLSGATITSNGVSYLLDFWLGEKGYGKYIQNQLKETQYGSSQNK